MHECCAAACVGACDHARTVGDARFDTRAAGDGGTGKEAARKVWGGRKAAWGIRVMGEVVVVGAHAIEKGARL